MRSIKSICKIFVIAFVSGVSTLGYSQTKFKQPQSNLVPIDPEVKIGTLSNGFTYYIRRNIEPKKRADLYLAVKAGSILEHDNQQGLAHLVEHMGFKGTKHYPQNELIDYLQKAGIRFGADLNAYTSFDETVYQLPIPTDDEEILANGIQILRDWAQDANFNPEDVDKERGVVLEEKRLRKGAGERMQNKYLPMLMNQSRYSKRLPIGTEEVLKTFEQSTIKQFYHDWYRPNLQALIIVGDIDVQAIEKTIIEKFSDLKNPINAPTRVRYEVPLLNKNQFIVVTDPEQSRTSAQILIKRPQTIIKNTSDLRQGIVRDLYNKMLNARLAEISKQPDPPFLGAGGYIGGFFGVLDAAATYMSAKPNEFERGLKAVLTEIERIRRFGFTPSELQRAKIAVWQDQESAYRERDKTNSQNFVYKYLGHFLNGNAAPSIDYLYHFYQQELRGISPSEINTLAKEFNEASNRDILILAPEKENLPDELTVNNWTKQVQQSDIKAYVDRLSDKPLIAHKPKAGSILSEKQDKDLGITELVLSNGMKVVLKPTDFQNDEIIFSGFSVGGTSIYSDQDFQSATNAASIVSQSGLGSFDAITLTKYLTGKQTSVYPSISERDQNISGSTTPKELETALQLVYLYFTQPRKDSEIFKGYITRQKAGLLNREREPNSVFADTINAARYGNNVRYSGPSIEKVNQINLERAYAIYKERFADASRFTFIFTGAFNISKIKPLIESYLGSLPNLSNKESARDLGILPVSGKIEKVVYKGRESKATVRLYFSGDFDYSAENKTQFDALREVLNIRLIERLRMDESGVYSVGAGLDIDKYPQPRYTFSISFGCAPENVEKLTKSALDEIEKICKKGAREDDIRKYIAESERSIELQLRSNSFWTGYLYGRFQNNEDIRSVLSYKQRLKSVSPERLQQLANKYLNGDNLAKFVLLPDSPSKSE